MFGSLWFKTAVDKIADECVDDRYEDSKVNDRSLGKMYYLKQIEKAAAAMYNAAREKIDTSKATSGSLIVGRDDFFNAVAQVRNGSSKIDQTKITDEIVKLLQAQVDPETGMELWPNIKAAVRAREIVEACTVYGKSSVAVSIVEIDNAAR